MSPVDLHGRLDERGLLDDAHSEGVYALALDVPDSVEAVQRRRLAVAESPWPDDMAAQFAAAERVVYVGESGDIYDRLMEHAESEKRVSTCVSTFEIQDIFGVWPGDRDNVCERNKAREISDLNTCVWCNGELY